MNFSPKSSYTQQVVRGWHYSIQWLQKKIHQFKSMFKSTHIHRTGSSIKRWNHQLICKVCILTFINVHKCYIHVNCNQFVAEYGVFLGTLKLFLIMC